MITSSGATAHPAITANPEYARQGAAIEPMTIEEKIRQIMLSEELSDSEKLDRLHALIPPEAFKIDNLNRATPAQLRQLRAIEHKDVSKLRELLEARGYKDIPLPNSTDCNFVLGNSQGHKVDVHSYTFGSDGKNVYGIAYPLESLTGTGLIDGHLVKRISAEWVVKFHTQYEPDENDFKDVHALCAKLNVPMPAIYVR